MIIFKKLNFSWERSNYDDWGSSFQTLFCNFLGLFIQSYQSTNAEQASVTIFTWLSTFWLWHLYFNTLEFSGYTGIPLKLNYRCFRGLCMSSKNYNLSVSWVHICIIRKRKNCLYVCFFNAILLMLLFTYYKLFYINQKSKRF